MAFVNPANEEKRPQLKLSLFALGFRPFFLLAGIAAICFVLIWSLAYTQGISISSVYPAHLWHSHEMIFAYCSAVVAGFLLTAVRNWTGINTTTPWTLAGLALLWLLARLAAVSPLPIVVPMSLNAAFLLLLVLAVARPIIRARQWNNLLFIPLLLAYAAADVLFHLGLMGQLPGGVELGRHFGLGLIIILIVVMAGRVIGFFIERGLPEARVRQWPWLERLVIGVSMMVFALQPFMSHELFAVLAFLGFLLHGIRMLGWYHRDIGSVPLLWILYSGYAWLSLGFLLLALAAMNWLAESLALHALTAGGIGLLTLGMMARVALGHTGRPMQSHRLIDMAFAVINLAVVFRVLLPIVLPAQMIVWIQLSSLLWALGFGLFVIIYTPILMRARVDGQAG